MNTTREAIAAVDAAATPSDLFGPVATDAATQRAARRRFHVLSRLVHPDRVTADESVYAAAAFARAAELYRRWQDDAGAGKATGGVALTGSAGTYMLGKRCARGSVTDIFHATDEAGAPVVLKIPRATGSNVLVENERAALADIAASADGGNEWMLPYFPRLVDRITYADAADGTRRSVNVLDDLTDGFVTLADVHAARRDGLDARDWAWMHRRLLRAVAAAHRAGWVHTAVTADNVLIHPEQHGVVLAGWSFATRAGEVPAATIGSQRAAYPPEAADRAPAAPEWDVYMVHALMLRMLGDGAPKAMRRFASGCMQAQPRRRPDAADLLAEFDDLLDRSYGRRRFRLFTMPTTKGQ